MERRQAQLPFASWSFQFSHLHREAPAIDAVLRARRAIAVAPVKLHLLRFESAGQAGAADEIVVFQKDGNCSKWKGRETKWVSKANSIGFFCCFK